MFQREDHRGALGVGAVDRREAALGVPAIVVRRAGRAEEERTEGVRRQALVALGLGVVAREVVG